MLALLERQIEQLYNARNPQWRAMLGLWACGFGVLRLVHLGELAPAGFPAPVSTSIVAVGSRRGTAMASTSRSLGTLCLVGTGRRGGWRSGKTCRLRSERPRG